jgi:SAM-dependent methyltransferase
MRVFDFGSNWQAFSEQRIDSSRIAVAVRSIQSLLQRDTLRDVDVLDVGCGSGLFSIAAYELGASNIVGVDINPHCIAVSEQNRDRFAPKAPIIFQEVSALDPESLAALGKFKLVYAWGSLHHTGAMWNAICNVAKQVSPDGTLVLAIYNKHLTSPAWNMIKWFYNRLPEFGQRLMTIVFAGIIYIAKFFVTRRNPLNKERGMDFWYDVIDWIGGYPYEYATRHEIDSFLGAQGFKLKHFVAPQVPTGCNEFVFERTGS